MRAFLALLMIATSIYAAHAIGLGREGRGFGKLGAMDKAASGGGGACTNKLDFSVACNSQYINTVVLH